MSVLIKGIYLPQNETYLDLVITADGNVCCYDHEGVSVAKAVELPDHGDLIDRDALFDDNSWDWFNEWGSTVNKQAELVVNAPVVVPAERSEE